MDSPVFGIFQNKLNTDGRGELKRLSIATTVDPKAITNSNSKPANHAVYIDTLPRGNKVGIIVETNQEIKALNQLERGSSYLLPSPTSANGECAFEISRFHPLWPPIMTPIIEHWNTRNNDSNLASKTTILSEHPGMYPLYQYVYVIFLDTN